MILDEPTNGLDPQGIADIRELIIKIGNSGKTIILASHLLDEVQKVCDEFIVLKKGKLIHQGKVEQKVSDTIVIEIASLDLKLLEETIRSHPDFMSLKHSKNRLEVKFKSSSDLDLVAQYLFDNKIVINHFSLLKKNLEHIFLEILEGVSDSKVNPELYSKPAELPNA